VFDPSNLCIASPKETDLDMAVLNFLSSMMREASMRTDFLNVSTQVDAGSQQFNNLGPYVTSDRSSMTASDKMEYLPLSTIVLISLTPTVAGSTS
jgi:hypothetical protein